MKQNEKEYNTKTLSRMKGRIALLLLGMGVVALAGIYRSEGLKVKTVDFEGYYFTEEADLMASANIPEGVHPDSMDLEALKKRIESLNYVDEAELQVEPGGDMTILVSEREPIGLLIQGANRAYVDHKGVILPILEDKILDLPLVYGFSIQIGDTLKTAAFEQVSDFLQTAKTDAFQWMTLSEVGYSAEEGVVALSYENGVKLIFGRNDFDRKLSNWEAFYAEVIRVKGMNSMKQIDLRFKNQVVTKEI